MANFQDNLLYLLFTFAQTFLYASLHNDCFVSCQPKKTTAITNANPKKISGREKNYQNLRNLQLKPHPQKVILLP